jgi:cell division protein FtsQ
MITETAEERRPLGGAPEEVAPKETAPKAKREPKAAKPTAPKRNERALWPIAIRAMVLAAAAIAFILVWHQLDQFLIADPRFVLAGPTEGGDESGVRVEGLKHTTREQIHKVFRTDFGRSIHLADLAERRRDLLAISWVKDASVSRNWPNRLVVRVQERKPFANVLLGIANENEAATRVALVDEEGVWLETVSTIKVDLPVLRGLTLGMQEPERKIRVGRAQRMLREAGELSDGISEIDVTDAENLKVTRPVGDRAFTLMLGRDQFRPRLENFYRVVDQIRRQYPKRTVFDLCTREIISPGEQAE